jgi:hypothetical protein
MPSLSTLARTQLDELLEQYPKDLSGTVIGVVNRQGEILYLSSTGPRLCGQPAPARPDDVSEHPDTRSLLMCRFSPSSHVPRW